MNIIKPPRLRKGDLIGLIAPASTPSSEEKILKGALYLEQLGYRVKCGKHIRTVYGYLAGAMRKGLRTLTRWFVTKT